MDVKFDATAAERLYKQMYTYCSDIQKEGRNLLDILSDSGQWNDNQMKAFRANMNELAKDLNQVLALESDYMRTFAQRIQEITG